jgi:hypothetical protein
MSKTNLPPPEFSDSANQTKLFFDSYGEFPLTFNAVDVDATYVFFQKRGFDNDAALVTSTTLLKQAQIDEVPIKKLLDTLDKLDGFQLSALIAEILNNNRKSISTLGYREKSSRTAEISRNIRV